MNEHTPGPWVALHEPGYVGDFTDNGGYRIDAPDDGVTQLAFVWVLNHRVPDDGRPQSEGSPFGDVRAGANARLIAAAPAMKMAGDELAAAAADIHPSAPSSASITRLHAAMDAWDAAIAKVKSPSTV